MELTDEELKKQLHKKDRKIKELESLVTIDPLTGILNRRGFLQIGQMLTKDVQFHAQNPNQRTHFVIDSFSVIFLDIDNFKTINDALGHEAGDQVLRLIANLISQKLRTSDFVGRWGGEELVIGLAGAGEKDAYQKAEEIRKAVRSRVKLSRHPDITITTSAGVAQLKPKEDLEGLIKRADEAMYQAKKTGKDKVLRSV